MKRIISILIVLYTVNSFAATFVVNSLFDNGFGTLRHNIGLASEGDTIRFNPNFINSGNQFLFLDTSIVFNKKIVIKGLYNATDTLFISAGPNSQHFVINTISSTSPYNIVFDSVCLINGNGGALGGAIKMNTYSDTLFVSNSIFKNNVATQGGVIFTQYAVLTNSIFENNHANSRGGVIDARYLVKIDGCSFSKNSAVWSGGVIYMGFTGSPVIEINNSTFNKNSAVWSGGVLVGRNVTIDSSRFSNNSSKYGGVTYNSSASFGSFYSINTCSFENNHSDSSGGVMYLRSYFYVEANIDACTFYNNSSGTVGGALHICPYYSQQSNFVVDINRCTFEKNRTHGKGSAINATVNYSQYNNDLSTLSLTNTTVYNNESALGETAVEFYSPNYKVSSANSIYSNNNGPNFSDTAFLTSKGFNIIDDSLFDAISSDYLSVSDVSLNLSDFQDNGGFSKTRSPKPGSVAINNGDPADTSDAQNRKLIGNRDIGAAEYNCQLKDSLFYTQCSLPISWRGKLINNTGIHREVILKASGCDSVYELVVEKINTGITIVHPYLKADDTLSSLQWLDCYNNFAPYIGDTGFYFSIPSNGSYALAVTKNGCTDTSQCIKINNLNLIENIEENAFLVFPNPTANIVNLKSISNELIDSYVLINNLGTILLKKEKIDKSELNIDLFDFPSGNYYLLIQSKNLTKTLKIIRI